MPEPAVPVRTPAFAPGLTGPEAQLLASITPEAAEMLLRDLIRQRNNLPIIIFGPSDPAVAHAPDEHVAIAQVVSAARFQALLALRQLSGQPYSHQEAIKQ